MADVCHDEMGRSLSWTRVAVCMHLTGLDDVEVAGSYRAPRTAISDLAREVDAEAQLVVGVAVAGHRPRWAGLIPIGLDHKGTDLPAGDHAHCCGGSDNAGIKGRFTSVSGFTGAEWVRGQRSDRSIHAMHHRPPRARSHGR